MQNVIVINDAFEPLLTENKRYIICYGGRRSSKSYSISQIVLISATKEPGHNCLVVRKVAKTIRLSVWARVVNELENMGIKHLCKVNKSEYHITLPNMSTINFVGMDDPEKLKSIENVTLVWIEEATELDEHEFDTLDAGISGADHFNRIFLSFNPIPLVPGRLHWLQRRFLNIEHSLGEVARGDNFAVLKTSYVHNMFCPQEVIKVIEGYKTENPRLYKMWALGDFAELEGVILTGWDIVKDIPDYADFFGYGLDFGYSIDPAALIGVWGNKKELWIKGLIYKTELTNQELANEMRAVGVGDRDRIMADKAEPKSIEELKREGFKGIKPCNKHPSYKAPAAQMLQGYKIHVISGDQDLINEITWWSWDRDKDDKILPKVADGNDHYMDALIYERYDGKPKKRMHATRL